MFQNKTRSLAEYAMIACRIPLMLALMLPTLYGTAQPQQPLFRQVPENRSGIRFTNTIEESDSLHIFKYEYLYNGHGIGIADFNKDGLEDVFISGNTVPSKLYLNKGNLSFEDATAQAGVQGNGHWRTGVSIADVNGDGWPDIYVCHSGPASGAALSNELFIHQGLQNGKPVFREMAAAVGLDAPGTLSTQAAFFDYDLDGDLDMFLVNHSNHTFNPYLNTSRQRATPDMRYGNRLFRNDRQPNGQYRFTDVTLSAGIINNALNFGLSVVISDLNKDGWPDIYTSSDYTEQDYCYLNNRNGSFRQVLQESFTHISKFSMGADIADINNDGWPEVYTLDMLPEDNYRQKLLKGPDEYDAYHLLLDSGYYHQQMRNMLHLHQGIDPQGRMRFSEIGQLAGISNTDWSWSALFADYDNDGWKDLMVTNGYLRDYTDNDFLKYTVADEQLAQAAKGNLQFKTYDLVKKMPSNKLRNYFFRNEGNLRFSDRSTEWGFVQASVSNCAAYADFDNDGDLDLIVGNNNEPVQLLENQQRTGSSNKYLQVQLEGAGWNTGGIGARVTVFAAGKLQTIEQYPVRGYQSSVSQVLHFGLGDADMIDSVQVAWPGGNAQTIYNVTLNSKLLCKQASGNNPPMPEKNSKPVFKDVTLQSGLDFRHQENEFIDFKVEVLLPYQLSKMGPALATADVNADGLDDIYLGGAIGQAGTLYLQQREGGFIKAKYQPWEADKESEDVRALFADFNKDKHPDLYVVSGGNEYEEGSPEFADRLYINDGKGNFTKLPQALPADMQGSKMAIAAADMDADGDLDLFIGGSAIPGAFPNASRSYLLRNEISAGTMRFTDVTASWSAELLRPGIVNAAAFADLNNDQRPDLLLAGEWMPVRLFQHAGTSYREASAAAGFNDHGLWSALLVQDVNADGLPDIVAGNAGNNLQFKASPAEPITLFASDIDDNGVDDVLFCYYINGKSYPAASRDELLDQVVPLRKRFVKYQQYANATVEDIVPAAKRKTAAIWKVTELSSVVYLNKGSHFEKQVLPPEAQFSRVFGIQTLPASGQEPRMLLTGNFFPWRVQWGRCDGGLGTLLQTDANGTTKVVPNRTAGLFASGDIRQAGLVKTAAGKYWVILARNNEPVQVLEIQE